ncbi:hypothetical protein HanRHA438_Chr15g0717601 [Helianthus annuus]|nr:hypothetical protein HanRHA438_Chr15g0717601 [Helianthus annuus]
MTTMELAMEEIMLIRQEGTVFDYCSVFQSLFERVKNSEDMSEVYAIYLFINGLEPRIREMFITWHQYSYHKVKDFISLALKIDANKLQDSFSPFDPKSSFYVKELVFDSRKILDEIMEGNESFKDGKIQEISNEDRVFDQWRSLTRMTGGGGSKTSIPKNFYRTRGSKTYITKNFYMKTTYITLLSEKFGGVGRPSPPLLYFATVFDESAYKVFDEMLERFSGEIKVQIHDESENDNEKFENEVVFLNEDLSIQNLCDSIDSRKDENKDVKLKCLDVLHEVVSVVDDEMPKRFGKEIQEPFDGDDTKKNGKDNKNDQIRDNDKKINIDHENEQENQ